MHEPNTINIILWLYRTMFKEITDLAYSVRVNCENSTYVSKSHSNTNYSNDKSLIVSLLKGQDSKVNASISLLAFPALNLEFNNINHAYLTGWKLKSKEGFLLLHLLCSLIMVDTA